MEKEVKGLTTATEEVKFEKAFVVPEKLGEEVIRVFGELPHKYSPIFEKALQGLVKCHRADVTLHIPKEEKSE